jgi:hypothetical protein
MRFTFIVAISLTILLTFAGCDPSSQSDIKEAHELANAGECVVTHTSNGTSTRSLGSAARCDLELFVSRRGGTQDEFELCLSKDNPQYMDYYSLREGDRINFEFVDSPTQGMFSVGNRATHVKFNRVYR